MKPVRVLLIVGANRSGTTLAGRVAGLVPGAVFAGEIAQVWARGFGANELCGCGEPFARCPMWTRVRRGLEDRLPSLDRDGMVSTQRVVDRLRNVPALAFGRTPGGRGRYEAFLEGVRALYLALADAADADVLVDSSKRLSYALMLADIPDLDVRVLHVVRDPRAVAFSKTRTRVRPEIVDREVHMGTRPPWRSALNWTLVQTLSGVLSSRFQGYATLRYEDLISDPAAAASRMAALMGVPGVPDVPVTGEIALGTSHSVSGNPMRLKAGTTVLRLDDEWTGAMSARDRLLVTALTAPLLPLYRYPLWPGTGRDAT